MPAKNFLNSETKEKLQKALKEHEHPDIRESGFSLRVIRRKNWCKKGTRKKKRGDRRRGRINVMGGVRYSDKRRWVDFIPTGNSVNFHLVLKTFYEDLKIEWVEEGNLEEEFQEKAEFVRSGAPIRDKLRKTEVCQGEKDLRSNSD